jgi:hypothetical protein
MEWVRRLKEPEEVKAYVWRKVICGLLRPESYREDKRGSGIDLLIEDV